VSVRSHFGLVRHLGDLDAARFSNPQGMAILGDTLYVADTDNHAIRAVNLKAQVEILDDLVPHTKALHMTWCRIQAVPTAAKHGRCGSAIRRGWPSWATRSMSPTRTIAPSARLTSRPRYCIIDSR
jgi:hypothetical protein